MSSTPPFDPDTGEVLAEPERRPYASWLLEQRRGGLAADLGDRLAEVSQAVVATQKKGRVVLTLEVEPNGYGAVKVRDAITGKVPEAAQPESFFYVDEYGNLTRNDPRQPSLPIVDEVAARRDGGAS